MAVRQRLALRASSGLDVGHIYHLLSKRNLIGRNVDAVVPLEDSKVSRSHAAIDFQNGSLFLVDLGSINGTFLNGKKVGHAVRLKPEDEIRVGSTVLRVEQLDAMKGLAPRSFHESTRTMMRDSLEIPTPTPSLREETGHRWRVLIDERLIGFRLTKSQVRWGLALIAVLVVLIAIGSTN